MKNNENPTLTRVFAGVFSPLTIVVWLSAIVVAVVAGPFGTLDAMGLGRRIVFWGIVVTVSVCLGYLVRAISIQVAGKTRPGLADAVAVALMTVIFAPFVWFLARYVEVTGDRTPPTLPETAFYVLIVTAAVFVVRRLTPGIETQTYRFQQDDPVPAPTAPGASGGPRNGPVPPAAPSEPMPRLLRRLPEQAHGQVLRLSARDHHVDVVTSAATVSLRMRLKDAIDEMEPVTGHCTHRSHWVAKDAIVRIRRDGPQKLFLELSNGDLVPVSRTYRPALEEAGFLPTPLPNGGTISAASARDAAQGRSSPQPPRGA